MLFNNYMTITDLMLNHSSNTLESLDEPTTSFLYSQINAFLFSDTVKTMETAQEYYKNNNVGISKKERFYVRDGVRYKQDFLNNSQLSHPFFRKLVRQRVNYLLSRPFTIDTEDEQFSEALTEHYLTDHFYSRIKNLGVDSVVNGIGWLQAYYNDKGELRFKRLPPQEVIPIWSDSDHLDLLGVIRTYVDTFIARDGSKTSIRKIEYYTEKGVWYFQEGPKGLEPDPTKEERLHGHFKVRVPNDAMEAGYEDVDSGWGRIPIIPFKYNSDELSLLNMVKSLIDDYDKNTSTISDNILDTPNNIKVVKGYDGTTADEFNKNVNTHGVLFLREGGDFDIASNEIDSTTAEKHLDRLRKDIYEAGNAVDTQELNLGNASGQAIKFKFADLHEDATDMGAEFKNGLRQCIWFMQVDMANTKGIVGYGAEDEVDYDIVFNTDTMINESEVIDNLVKSLQILSEETVVAQHPWVKGVEEELDRKKKQREEQQKEMEEMMGIQQPFNPTQAKNNFNQQNKKPDNKTEQ